MKKFTTLFLTAFVSIGLLVACAPAAVQTPTPEAAPQPTATTPTQATPAAAEPAQVEDGFQRGLTVVGAAETSAIAPARQTALIGHFKNVMTHNGLFRVYHGDLSPIPDVVSEWHAISDTLFEFTIREGIQFHNGDIMTAYDVAASLEYVRTHPEQRALHASVAGWEVVDEMTIRIDSGEPNAVLFNDLAHQANFLMPRSLIDSGHDFMTNPVGSGPFVFEEWRHGDFLHFNAFENYFDEDRFPRIGYVHWRIVPEGSSRTIALETGEVDYVIDVAFPDIPRLEANPDITVQQTPGATFSYFLLNNARPQFESVYVRRAIDMALDREAMLIASLDGFGVPVYTTVPPIFPGVSHEGTRSFDPDGAAALLAEHGVDPASIGFEMLAFDETQRRRAEVAQANLADIGIPTTITMVDFATWLPLTTGDEFEASFANNTPNTLVVFMRNLMTIESIDVQNRARINNPELSGLINQALTTVDTYARNAILYEATRVANEYSGFIGTNMNIVFRAFNSNLRAPELAANGFMYMNMMYWVD